MNKKKQKNRLVIDKQVVKALIAPDELTQVEGGRIGAPPPPPPPGGQTSGTGC